MSNSKHPKKKVSDIVRKLLDVGDMSIKEAAQYLNYTEQSFRNKLSRDSFSLRDLFILCDVCGASPMIEYSSADPEYDCQIVSFLQTTFQTLILSESRKYKKIILIKIFLPL